MVPQFVGSHDYSPDKNERKEFSFDHHEKSFAEQNFQAIVEMDSNKKNARHDR